MLSGQPPAPTATLYGTQIQVRTRALTPTQATPFGVLPASREERAQAWRIGWRMNESGGRPGRTRAILIGAAIGGAAGYLAGRH